MLKQSEDQTINFRTVRRYKGREKFRIAVIELQHNNLTVDSWLTEALTRFSKSSFEMAFSDNIFYGIRYALNILSENIYIESQCNLNRSQLREDNIRSIFECLDSSLDNNSKLSPEVKYKTSAHFRTFVFDYLARDKDNRITKSSLRYKTPFITQRKPRSILTGDTKKALNSEDAPPLGATPFESYEELISSSLFKLEKDLKKITDACAADLTFYADTRKILETIKSIPYDERHESLLKEHSTSKYTSKSHIKHFSMIPPKQLLSCYLNFIEKNQLLHANATLYVKYQAKNLLTAANIIPPPPYNEKHIFGLLERLAFIELHAIMVTLLCHTGWNVSSLLNLTIEGITPQDDGFELQGFKDKTDDHTPISFVDKKETNAVTAINLLLWNRSQLIKLGFIKKTDTRLWLSWSNTNKPYIHQSSALYKISKDFIARHNLFKFSAEQLRTQVMNIRHYQTRDIEHTRRTAGHRNISTTSDYLDQIFAHNINSSVNLDFQKKLENKIIFNMGKEKNIDENGNVILIAIGDGTSCIDPSRPSGTPVIEEDFICSARKCHLGEGCENRRIIINEDRLIEIARQHHYYSNNWKRLHSQNAENFKLTIAPAMLFNTLLHDFIITSAYGHILKKLGSTIAND